MARKAAYDIYLKRNHIHVAVPGRPKMDVVQFSPLDFITYRCGYDDCKPKLDIRVEDYRLAYDCVKGRIGTILVADYFALTTNYSVQIKEGKAIEDILLDGRIKVEVKTSIQSDKQFTFSMASGSSTSIISVPVNNRYSKSYRKLYSLIAFVGIWESGESSIWIVPTEDMNVNLESSAVWIPLKHEKSRWANYLQKDWVQYGGQRDVS